MIIRIENSITIVICNGLRLTINFTTTIVINFDGRIIRSSKLFLPLIVSLIKNLGNTINVKQRKLFQKNSVLT